MSEILKNVFIGDAHDAMYPNVSKFRCVINVSREVPFSKLLRKDVATMRIDVLDEGFRSEQDALFSSFDAACKLIDRCRANDVDVLVHCLEGKMRSCSVLAAYLMGLGMTLEDSKREVRCKHEKAFDYGCYSHFEDALHKWAVHCHAIETLTQNETTL